MSPPREQRARTGWALALIGLSGLGCDRAASPRHLPVAPAVEAPLAAGDSEERARAEETAALVSWLREQALSEERFFAPRVLYTWTRAEQIAELRAEPVLLTRSRGAGGARSGFDHALDGDDSHLARFLRRRSARRFAWTSPWATRAGWPSADYGDRLVRVELRAEAWIARFDPSEGRVQARSHDGPQYARRADGDPDRADGPRWDVRDAGGAAVDDRAVRAEPWRVAAVYHQGRGPGADGSERVWREYVLVSEPMIARWSVGDAATARVLARDREQLAVLADRWSAPSHRAPSFEPWARGLSSRWRGTDSGEIVALYDCALALGSELYVPDAAHVRAVVRSLELPAEPPLSHAPAPYVARRPRVAPRARPGVWCDPTMGCPP